MGKGVKRTRRSWGFRRQLRFLQNVVVVSPLRHADAVHTDGAAALLRLRSGINDSFSYMSFLIAYLCCARLCGRNTNKKTPSKHGLIHARKRLHISNKRGCGQHKSAEFYLLCSALLCSALLCSAVSIWRLFHPCQPLILKISRDPQGHRPGRPLCGGSFG